MRRRESTGTIDGLLGAIVQLCNSAHKEAPAQAACPTDRGFIALLYHVFAKSKSAWRLIYFVPNLVYATPAAAYLQRGNVNLTCS